MKQLFIFTATILACMGMRAQETGIDSVLRQIEANNKELQANAQLISSQKLESRTENNLPDPTLSYAHLWDSKNSDETVGEMVVSQSFDFPTLYITRGKMNRLKTEHWMHRRQPCASRYYCKPKKCAWTSSCCNTSRSCSIHG